MGDLRRWQLDAAAPYTLNLAADARLSQTDYLDDQTWKFVPGTLDTPALVLKTQYAGRVANASLAPVWQIENRRIQQHQIYTTPPIITAFAPAFAQADGKITPELDLQTICHVVESHAMMVTHAVTNTGKTPVSLRLDVLAHVSYENRDLPLAIISLANGTVALSLGRLPGLEPVLLLEGAQITRAGVVRGEARIGVKLEVAPGTTQSFRYVHAGLEKMAMSLERAQFWLAQDATARLEAIHTATESIPQIETSDPDHDATIAFSYQQLIQSIMRPTGNLPYASLVLTRKPDRGYSQRGDGSDYPRGWNGLSAQMTYLLGSAMASVEAEVAKGLLRNFIANQTEDGAIDMAPGLGGQRSGLLAPPILARYAWNIYKLTEDIAFLREVFPALLQFFNHWSTPPLDADLDSMPEYQDERQTGYVFWPTFGSRESWAQNADIRLTETPDMAAYLISEVVSLAAIARELQDPGAYELTNRIVGLQAFLERLWRDELNRYSYQDRDNDAATPHVPVLTDARADEEHIIALDFDVPSRLIVRVDGGSSRVPRGTVTLEGRGRDGSKQTETLELSADRWGYGHGTVISKELYKGIDRVQVEGLSRLFKITVHTVDYTRLDINALLPLMLGELPTERIEALVKLVSDEAHFWQPNGLTLVPASDPNYDPASARGGGGVWLYWLTLIGEGLLDSGHAALATKLVKRTLKAQTQVLKKEKHFSEFYHASSNQGLGESAHLSGIVPLFLLLRVLGVQIVDARRVYAGGSFHWGSPVTIKQHGVTVTRSDAGTTVTFPSGYVAKMGANANWGLIEDVKAPVTVPPQPDMVIPPKPTETGVTKRVVIEVRNDEEQD